MRIAIALIVGIAIGLVINRLSVAAPAQAQADGQYQMLAVAPTGGSIMGYLLNARTGAVMFCYGAKCSPV